MRQNKGWSINPDRLLEQFCLTDIDGIDRTSIDHDLVGAPVLVVEKEKR